MLAAPYTGSASSSIRQRGGRRFTAIGHRRDYNRRHG